MHRLAADGHAVVRAWVAADDVEGRAVDEATHHQFYKARVAIRESELARLDGLDLLPGMPAEVFINTGERKALTYFVKPFADRLARTFREE